MEVKSYDLLEDIVHQGGSIFQPVENALLIGSVQVWYYIVFQLVVVSEQLESLLFMVSCFLYTVNHHFSLVVEFEWSYRRADLSVLSMRHRRWRLIYLVENDRVSMVTVKEGLELCLRDPANGVMELSITEPILSGYQNRQW